MENPHDRTAFRLSCKVSKFSEILRPSKISRKYDFFDEIFGFSGELHLASLSISIQSLFILPALIKYNFLNQPMEKIGDELYAHSSDAVVITNKSGIILNLNQSARKLFRLKGKVVKKNIMELFTSNYNHPDIVGNYDTKTKLGKNVSITQSNISKGKQSLGKILVIRDISKRIKAEENLYKSEKAYRHVIESSSDIIYNTDVNGIVTYINPVFEKLSGYKEKEVIGTDINKKAQISAKQTLEGIENIIIDGDISTPNKINKTLNKVYNLKLEN